MMGSLILRLAHFAGVTSGMSLVVVRDCVVCGDEYVC